MSKLKQITEIQLRVLTALARPGNRAHFMRYMGRFNPTAYYTLREGSPRRCTKQIDALVKHKLAKITGLTQFGDHDVVISAAGRKFLIAATVHPR